jgi:hypothetical protein
MIYCLCLFVAHIFSPCLFFAFVTVSLIQKSTLFLLMNASHSLCIILGLPCFNFAILAACDVTVDCSYMFKHFPSTFGSTG